MARLVADRAHPNAGAVLVVQPGAILLVGAAARVMRPTAVDGGRLRLLLLRGVARCDRWRRTWLGFLNQRGENIGTSIILAAAFLCTIFECFAGHLTAPNTNLVTSLNNQARKRFLPPRQHFRRSESLTRSQLRSAPTEIFPTVKFLESVAYIEYPFRQRCQREPTRCGTAMPTRSSCSMTSRGTKKIASSCE